MKKSLIVFGIFLFVMAFVSAEACSPDVTLINQDPYPAIPGEYVKLVFQVNNIGNPECENLVFEILETYPVEFDENFNAKTSIGAGFYDRDYSSFLIAPYKVRIDEAAVEGDNPIETKLSYQTGSYIYDEFNVYVEDSKANFELHIDKYSYATKELTVEILNIADSDVEALTIEIPKQERINVIGTNRIVVGDLDSNEYTTADFKANVQDGEIEVKVLYTDQTGTRRESMEKIFFDSSYFTNTIVSTKPGLGTYITILVVIGLGVWWFMKRRKKKRERHHHRHNKGSARLG